MCGLGSSQLRRLGRRSNPLRIRSLMRRQLASLTKDSTPPFQFKGLVDADAVSNSASAPSTLFQGPLRRRDVVTPVVVLESFEIGALLLLLSRFRNSNSVPIFSCYSKITRLELNETAELLRWKLSQVVFSNVS